MRTFFIGLAVLVACSDPVTLEPGVEPRNAEPLAAFAFTCTDLTCHFIDQSTDPDPGGSVASRAWNFGDGQTSVEQNPTHTYASPGGLFTVTLRVTDDKGARASAANDVGVAMRSSSDRSGIYQRETPHSTAGRHSRYVIRSDGTFELRDGSGVDTTVFTGRWWPVCCWVGWVIPPGSVIGLDFDAFQNDRVCGEAFGSFLLDGHMGVAYCWAAIQAGLEEGVYTTDPVPGAPGPAPPQAGQIAFVRGGRIYLANTNGGGVVPLSAGPNDGAPAWSPDGSRIAFNRGNGGSTGILVMDADGSNVAQLTTSGGTATWSPDGQWIAFICSPYPARLCKVRTDGGGATPVSIFEDAGRVEDPAWSPDGTRIAFMSDGAGYDIFIDIWVVAPDGSARAALTTHTPAAPNPYEHYQPAWSPDAHRIAFVTCPWAFDYCSSSAVSVMSADGSGLVRLVAASGFANPTWSPDGQVIAFASSNAIEWVSTDGTQRGRIIDNGHSPAWRP